MVEISDKVLTKAGLKPDDTAVAVAGTGAGDAFTDEDDLPIDLD